MKLKNSFENPLWIHSNAGFQQCALFVLRASRLVWEPPSKTKTTHEMHCNSVLCMFSTWMFKCENLMKCKNGWRQFMRPPVHTVCWCVNDFSCWINVCQLIIASCSNSSVVGSRDQACCRKWDCLWFACQQRLNRIFQQTSAASNYCYLRWNENVKLEIAHANDICLKDWVKHKCIIICANSLDKFTFCSQFVVFNWIKTPQTPCQKKRFAVRLQTHIMTNLLLLLVMTQIHKVDKIYKITALFATTRTDWYARTHLVTSAKVSI